MRGVGLIGQRRAIKAAEPVIALGKFDRMLKMAGRKLHAISVKQRKRHLHQYNGSVRTNWHNLC
ncbi:hypothetical protein ASE79_12890 [Sphingomonas sp. Leaf28]|nr:hypothetical protein ASE79_12890 [Sphingomonas sp. Leaf28]